jgi:type IX secretion system PorP/SprF family membrane protein
MILKKVIIILFLGVIVRMASAQQMPLFSQYLYNKFMINPAVAGSDGYTTINIAVREQWVGITRAPQTYSLSVQTRFLKRGYILKTSKTGKQVFRPKTDAKVGLGGSIFCISSGLIQRSGAQMGYSYHMWLQKETQLSLGLSFNGYYFRINEKEVQLEDPNDPVLNSNLRRGIFVPDASFGVYLLNRKYNAGFSANQLFGAVVKTENNAYASYNVKRIYYLFGSYGFIFGSEIEIRPSCIIRMSEQLKPQADLGLNISFDESLWVGLAYRTNGDLIANLGMRYSSLYIGYALDFSFNSIQRITYGTHEVNLAWKFGDSSRKYRWLDRY